MHLAALAATAAAAPVDAGTFLGWGPIAISLGNVVVIVAMLVLFAGALVVPFIRDKDR
jgi:hypothetical protein